MKGKNALQWSRLSCHEVVDSQVHPSRFALASDLADFLGRMGCSSKTYAFGKTGPLLSESRFEASPASAALAWPRTRQDVSIEETQSDIIDSRSFGHGQMGSTG
jgi:hypothetical protein